MQLQLIESNKVCNVIPTPLYFFGGRGQKNVRIKLMLKVRGAGSLKISLLNAQDVTV